MTQAALTEDELNHALDLAIRAAHTAAAIINRAVDERPGVNIDVTTKSNSTDLVTQFDTQCEEEVLNILRTGTPTYAVVSEETHGDVDGLGDGPTWIVDPIDGTTSFAHGLFDCCVSIALVVHKEPVLGVVCAPRLQEVFTAVKGRGAFSNGQRIHVSPTASLRGSVVLTHYGYNRSEAAIKSMMAMQVEMVRLPVHAVRCQGSAALDMCFVAAGRAELYLEAGVHAWDVAAGAIIVREAGGVVHGVESTDTFDLTRRSVCCANSAAAGKFGVELAIKHDYRAATLAAEAA